MSEVFNASKRLNQGTSASRRLRREGQVPAIIYGDNQEPVNIAINQNAIFHALQKENFHTQVLSINVEGTDYKAIVRDFQLHPYKPLVLHVDFQIVELDNPIKIKLPLHFINGEQSPAVKLHAGRISRIANSIEVIALPADIPEKLILDLKNITGGQILHLSDIEFPKGVESTVLKKGKNPPVVSATGKNK